MDKTSIYRERSFYIILAVTLLSVAGVTSIIPVFPDMSEELNVSRNKIGWLITIFSLPGAVLSPLLGMIIDRVGRKRVLISTLTLFGITGALCFFLRVFETILILRFIQGIGAACLGILNFTLIGDIFSGDNKKKMMGYNSGAVLVGSAIFAAIGGLLATFDWYYPFLLPAIALIVAAWVYVDLDNPEPKEQPRLNRYLRNILKTVFTKKAIWLFLLCLASFILLYGPIMTYMPLLLKDNFNLSSSEIGFMLFILAMSTAVVASQLHHISNLLSVNILFIIGFATYLIGLLLIPFLENIYLVLLCMLIIGIGQGINIPAIYNILTDIAPINHRGAFMSVNSMIIRGGQTIGPLFAGILYGLWGLSWVFWAGAIVAISLILLILFFIPAFSHA